MSTVTIDLCRPSRRDINDTLTVTVCRGSVFERLQGIGWLLFGAWK